MENELDEFQQTLDELVADETPVKVGDMIQVMIATVVDLAHNDKSFQKLLKLDSKLYTDIVNTVLADEICASLCLCGYGEEYVLDIAERLGYDVDLGDERKA